MAEKIIVYGAVADFLKETADHSAERRRVIQEIQKKAEAPLFSFVRSIMNSGQAYSFKERVKQTQNAGVYSIRYTLEAIPADKETVEERVEENAM